MIIHEFDAWRQGHTRGVTSVAWSGDGKRLASAGDKTVKVWNLDEYQSQMQPNGAPGVTPLPRPEMQPQPGGK